MTAIVSFDCVEDILQCVRETGEASQCLPVGARTKPALSHASEAVKQIEMRPFSGIVSYDPSEFLITAQAGTPVSELESALAEHGQYLPFDPVLAISGATIGGSIGAGISGSSRMLYGGMRDFVMEVELIDGTGNLVRGGGKVVKNAAGFDLPKLVVGSYGRLGIMTELTLKVLPAPEATVTIVSAPVEIASAVKLMQLMLSQPLPICAMDIQRDGSLVVRFAGPRDGLPGVVSRATELSSSIDWTASADDAEYWKTDWLDVATDHAVAQDEATNESLVRIACDRSQLVQLMQSLEGFDEVRFLRACRAGSEVWISVASGSGRQQLNQQLQALGLSAVVVSGSAPTSGASATSPFLGNTSWIDVAQRIQNAADPRGCFPRYDA